MLTDDDDFFYEDKIVRPCEASPVLIQLNEDCTADFEASNRNTDDVAGSSKPPDIDDTAVLCTNLDLATEKFGQLNKQKYELDRLGMTVTTNAVVINKDQSNLIGISIGGGAPMCPCLYIVQARKCFRH
ncbi:hypothetical protein ACLKA7_004531 [Drosophila subpalustris]